MCNMSEQKINNETFSNEMRDHLSVQIGMFSFFLGLLQAFLKAKKKDGDVFFRPKKEKKR